jgi:hypothetical protein
MRAVRDFIAGFRALHFDRWVTCRSFFVRKVLLFKYSYALDSAVTVDVMPSSDSMFGRGVAGS